MCKSHGKWKQLKIKSRFYSHIYNKLRNFATVIPLSLRELVFYSTNLSLPIFLFTREVVVLYFIIYQDIIIHGKPCLLNICPYFAISLFCIGEEGIFMLPAWKILLFQWKESGVFFQFLTVFSYLCIRNTSLVKKPFKSLPGRDNIQMGP